MPFTQDQAIALLSLLSEGKLISELTELLTLDTDNNFVAINSGSNDAKKIKIPSTKRGWRGLPVIFRGSNRREKMWWWFQAVPLRWEADR